MVRQIKFRSLFKTKAVRSATRKEGVLSDYFKVMVLV